MATNIAEPISSGPTMRTAARVEAAAWKRVVKELVIRGLRGVCAAVQPVLIA